MNYKGKRLLILGGISHMIDVVLKCKELQIYTIVCDYSLDSPAKRIADKSYDVSTNDINKISEICRLECVNGVFAGFEDFNTWNALNITREVNLPFYASEEQLSLTSNKDLFKNLCRKKGIKVVEEILLNDEFNMELYRDSFPLIVKPTDSYGSRGITICYEPIELISAIEKAKANSKTGSFTIEKFYKGYGVEMYYTVIDYTPYLTAITDRHILQQGRGIVPLPTVTMFPSRHLDTFNSSMLNKNLRELIKHLKIKHGTILFQAVRDHQDFYIYEMAYRLTGEQHYQIIQKETKFDLLKMMIGLSLNIDPDAQIKIHDSSYLPYPACNYAIIVSKGTIKKIDGIEEISKKTDVISCIQTLYEGDSVDSVGNYGQILARFNIISKDIESLKSTMEYIDKSLIVISDANENMRLNYSSNLI